VADEVRAKLGALYVDGLRYDDPPEAATLINMIPGDGEMGVPEDATVSLVVASLTAGALIGVTKVWMTRASDQLRVLAYDQAGGGFQNGFTGTATPRSSVGTVTLDELALTLVPPVNFLSQDLITVEVYCEVVGEPHGFNLSYGFQIADTTAPTLYDIFWLDPQKARVQFDEPVLQSTAKGGALYLQSTVGGVEILSSSTVRVTGLPPSQDWVGLWAGIAGSAWPANNGYRKVTAVNVSARTVTLDTTGDRGQMVPDDGRDLTDEGKLFRRRDLRFVVSPYRIRARMDLEAQGLPPTDPDGIQCAYEPLPTKVSSVPAAELASGADPDEFVYLEVHDLISFGRRYQFQATQIQDQHQNTATDISLVFTSPTWGIPGNTLGFWSPGIVAPRDPEWDMAHSGELRRMAVVLQDGLNCLHWHNRVIELLYEAHLAPEDWIEHWLYTRGMPFRFDLQTLSTMRRLPETLPRLYRKVGLASAIEEMIFVVLGLEMEVRPFVTDTYWILDDATWSVLDYTTVLGPSTAFHRNCYEIVSPKDLTDEEQNIVRQIAEWADPMNMHLIRILMPSTYTGGSGSYVPHYWILGQDTLGESTVLG